MARKAPDGGVNKSAAIREVLRKNPKAKAAEIVSTLAARGIKVAPGLVYFIKGKMRGKRGKRRRLPQDMSKVAATTGQADVLTTIRKVKTLAADVGGLKTLLALVEALSE